MVIIHPSYLSYTSLLSQELLLMVEGVEGVDEEPPGVPLLVVGLDQELEVNHVVATPSPPLPSFY